MKVFDELRPARRAQISFLRIPDERLYISNEGV